MRLVNSQVGAIRFFFLVRAFHRKRKFQKWPFRVSRARLVRLFGEVQDFSHLQAGLVLKIVKNVKSVPILQVNDKNISTLEFRY